MCNRRTRNPKHELNHDIHYDKFLELVDEIKPFYVTLNGLGEPLLNRDIDRVLRACRERRITTSMPCNLSVGKVLRQKIAPGPPSIITFSIHGASPEVFEQISRKSQYDQCLSALGEFLAVADRSRTEVRVLCVLQHANLAEHKKMFALLKNFDLLDNFSLVPVHDYGDDLPHQIIPADSAKAAAASRLDADILKCTDAREAAFYQNWRRVALELRPHAQRGFRENKPCLIPWFSTYISAMGDVLPCCYLTSEPQVMGNINHESFTDIWNGEKYRGFRAALRERRLLLPGCRHCERDDSSRIRAYGLPYRRKTSWPV
jgi:radical SAM protein with 4Fe4S-binding SPASM domain